MDDREMDELEDQFRRKKAERNYNFFRPVGQFIEHVDTINFSMDKDGTFHFENIGQVNGDVPKQPPTQTESEEQGRGQGTSEEELFHFIHPSVPSEQERQIHDEVKRLLKRHGIPEICRYLMNMATENKILLPQMPSVAYAELVRMGMPNGEGFSEKYFKKHYNK